MTKRVVCALATLCVSVVYAQAAKPNFSGTWRVDPEKSTSQKTLKKNPKLDEQPAPPPVPDGTQVPLEIIEHLDTKLKIIRPMPDGRQSTVTFTTDGKENVLWRDKGTIQQHSKSHWKGPKLVTAWVLVRDGKVFMQGVDVRSLSEDGKTMIVERKMADAKSETVEHTELKKQP